ncbi:MAG: hypothetical protein JJ979_02385 [Roseibium sp.]|nr:hypothetical protein [Roseibium sp.]
MATEKTIASSEQAAQQYEADGWERTGECDYGRGVREIYLERDLKGLALAQHIVTNAGVFTEEQIYALSEAFEALAEQES